MGRVLLSLAAGALLVACGGVGDGGHAHADLACAACHQGPRGERGRATVPPGSCTTAGCHGDGGAERVQVATVAFEHRNHGAGAEIALSCAGCHTHDVGEDPLRASVDACAYCHISDVTAGGAQECRLCHQDPDHTQLTSQGVAVSHSQLPWIDIGCVRCHYDVSTPETAVEAATCVQCHRDLEQLNAAAVGRDLHPIHDGVTCTACHREGTHAVQAMSSVVQLVCSDCHRVAHDLPLGSDAAPASATCAECHRGVHAPQQRLILGIRPDDRATPSMKFLAGITCRSCHVPTARTTADPAEPIRGTATSCAGCHPHQYEQVLDWWVDGVATRLGATTRYIDGAARAVGGGPPESVERIELARAMVALVREAGGHHNLELSDQLMREALEEAAAAYRAAGRTPPGRPDLGRVPHTGLCSYCHYDPGSPWDFRAMPEDFHRSLVRSE